MLRFITIAVLLLLCSSVVLAQKDKADDEKEEKLSYKYSGAVNRPYVIYRSSDDGFYYIGSTSGPPDIKNGQGQISVLSFEDFFDYKVKPFKNPVIISSQYPRTSIDAPKGIVSFNNYIIATDLEALAIFKKVEQGRPKQVGRLKVKGAKNLESIVKIDDTFYVSDSKVNGIFKLTNLMDPKKREVTLLTRIPSPKGIVYDSAKNALLIVSSKVNKMYEYNLDDPKMSTSYTIGPPVSKDNIASYTGFTSLCIGNQKEIYLTHYDLNKVMVYFRDEDRPATVKKPMKYARVFLKDARAPTSIIYDKVLNRIAFTQFPYNIISFNKALPAQLTDNVLDKGIE